MNNKFMSSKEREEIWDLIKTLDNSNESLKKLQNSFIKLTNHSDNKIGKQILDLKIKIDELLNLLK